MGSLSDLFRRYNTLLEDAFDIDHNGNLVEKDQSAILETDALFHDMFVSKMASVLKELAFATDDDPDSHRYHRPVGGYNAGGVPFGSATNMTMPGIGIAGGNPSAAPAGNNRPTGQGQTNVSTAPGSTKSQPNFTTGAGANNLAQWATGNAVAGGRSSIDGVHPEFANRISNMVANMPPDIAKKFNIISGFRDQKRQQEVNPGVTNSHHTQGMAVDTTWDPDVRHWITQNGSKYGVGYPLASDPKEGNHMEPLENGARIQPKQMAQWAQTHQTSSPQVASDSSASPKLASNSPNIPGQSEWTPSEWTNAPVESKQSISNPERNNPGNLRVGPNDWIGKVTPPGSAFEHFDTMDNGVRARAITYGTYLNRGINTIDQISNTSGPASDGNNIASQNQAYRQALGGQYMQPGGENLPIPRTPENIRRLTAAGISIEAGGGGRWLPQGVNTKMIDTVVGNLQNEGHFSNVQTASTPKPQQVASATPTTAAEAPASAPPPAIPKQQPQQTAAAIPNVTPPPVTSTTAATAPPPVPQTPTSAQPLFPDTAGLPKIPSSNLNSSKYDKRKVLETRKRTMISLIRPYK